MSTTSSPSTLTARSIGTLYGAVVGAAIFLALVEVISHYTDFWAMYVGVAVIARVLLIRDGLFVALRRLVTP